MTCQMAQLDLLEVLSSVSTLLNVLRVDVYLATVNSIDTFIEVSSGLYIFNELTFEESRQNSYLSVFQV